MTPADQIKNLKPKQKVRIKHTNRGMIVGEVAINDRHSPYIYIILHKQLGALGIGEELPLRKELCVLMQLTHPDIKPNDK